MKTDFPLIITSQYVHCATQWLKAVSRGESSCVLFIPRADRYIRVAQLINDTILQKNILGTEKKYIFQQINFDAHDVEDVIDLQFQIVEHLNFSYSEKKLTTFTQWKNYLDETKTTLVLVLPEGEKFVSSENKQVFSILSETLISHLSKILVMAFFEIDISHSSIGYLLPSVGEMYENIFRYPLYPLEHTYAFIELLSNQWETPIDKNTAKKIITKCGGHFWLVKEAVRQIVNTGSWSCDNESMQFRFRSIYDLLLLSEKSLIQKIVTINTTLSPEEEMSREYLQKMNFIDKNGKLRIGGFENFIISHESKGKTLELKNNQIFLNEIPVDKFFSRKEYRTLKLLLQKQNEIVSRDELAKAVWPLDTQLKFSDWALDQLIARARKRLVELSLTSNMIQVVRGKGVKLIN